MLRVLSKACRHHSRMAAYFVFNLAEDFDYREFHYLYCRLSKE